MLATTLARASLCAVALALAVPTYRAQSSLPGSFARGTQELGVTLAQAIVTLHWAALTSTLALALAKGIERPRVKLGLHWWLLRWLLH